MCRSHCYDTFTHRSWEPPSSVQAQSHAALLGVHCLGCAPPAHTQQQPTQVMSSSTQRLDGLASLYHERQRLQHCLKHAVNNLFQETKFTVAELNAITDSVGASRTILLGNYDANVLSAVLARESKVLKWHDARDTAMSALDLDDPALFGLICNVKGGSWLSWLTGGRHWIAIRKLRGSWYNLDSELPAPESFAFTAETDGKLELLQLLTQLQATGAHILLVMDTTA